MHYSFFDIDSFLNVCCPINEIGRISRRWDLLKRMTPRQSKRMHFFLEILSETHVCAVNQKRWISLWGLLLKRMLMNQWKRFVSLWELFLKFILYCHSKKGFISGNFRLNTCCLINEKGRISLWKFFLKYMLSRLSKKRVGRSGRRFKSLDQWCGWNALRFRNNIFDFRNVHIFVIGNCLWSSVNANLYLRLRHAE